MINRRGFLAGAAATAAAAALPMPPAPAEEGVMSGTALRLMFMNCAPRVRPMAGDYYVMFVPRMLQVLRDAEMAIADTTGIRTIERVPYGRG